MPEYRLDQSTGRMVIVAEERATRPYQFDIEDDLQDGEPYRSYCPFCEGNESLTPGEISAFRDNTPDSAGWTVRTVPNLYPAVVCGNEKSSVVPTFTQHGSLQASTSGVGVHEVIVDTPRHLLSVTDMTETEVEAMLRMYAVRLQALRSEQRFASAIIFKNVGQAAGASLPHSHSQLIALPFVPELLRTELDQAAKYAAKEQSLCLGAICSTTNCKTVAVSSRNGNTSSPFARSSVAFRRKSRFIRDGTIPSWKIILLPN